MSGRRPLAALAAALLLAATPALLRAQADVTLAEGIRFYRSLEVERARDRFLQVLSPGFPFVVSDSQRVTAYKYLGAALATLEQQDSSLVYFRAAIERDPFVDLDPQTFSEQERNVFAEAKRRVFRVGVRAIPLDTIDPRSEAVRLSVLTTHSGTVTVEVNSLVEDLRFPLYQGVVDGVRDLQWNGAMPGGRLVPQGSYELVVSARSGTVQRSDSARVSFDVAQLFETLEDTLRSIGPADLLPEAYPRSAAIRGLAYGLGIGVAAFVVPKIVGSGPLGTSGLPTVIVALSGAMGGGLAYSTRTRHPEIPANVTRNERVRTERDRRNAAIVTRNTDRLARTQLVFTPAASLVR